MTPTLKMSEAELASNTLSKIKADLEHMPGAHVTIEAAAAASLLQLFERDPEKFRRELKSLETNPIQVADGIMLDYAMAGTLIDRAVHHLDEALPTGQKRRGELAFALLRQGVDELAVWMRAVGYVV
jgi:hypothetical protein